MPAKTVTAFRQGRFDELPETPHVPHAFARTVGMTCRVDVEPFGAADIHVRTFGSGPPLLLVHGLMTSSYSWRYVFEPLGEHFTCYAPDLPGAGRSDRCHHAPFSPVAMARLIGAIQAELGIRGCAAIGNSMGGYLCMLLALDDPGAMSRLINLHSPGVPELRLEALRAALAIPGSRGLLRWLVNRDPLRWAHKNVHYYDEALKSLEEAREYGDVLRGDGADTLYKYLKETMNVGAIKAFKARLLARREQTKPFPIPLRLLYAPNDPMVPPRFGTVLSGWIPSAEFSWLERGSHFAHVDAVDVFLPPALAFLRA